MNDKLTKIYIYGRSTTGTVEKLQALECPDELIPWFENKKATKEGLLISDEIFFTMQQLTDDEISKMDVIDLGAADIPHFYMSEKINDQYVTYVTSDPTGPGMLLYPVTWRGAKIYIFKDGNGQYYQASLPLAKIRTPNPSSQLCTRDLMLNYRVGLNNPYQDPQNSEIVEKILAHLALKKNASSALPIDVAEAKPSL